MKTAERILALILGGAVLVGCVPNAFAAVSREETKENSAIYVSDAGKGDGSTVDNPASFLEAVSKAKDGDSFTVIGTVNLPEEWESPEADISIQGREGSQAVLMMQPGGTNVGEKASMLLKGNVRFNQVTLDVTRPNQYNNVFVIAANGHKLEFGSSVSTPSDTSTYSGYVFGGGFHKKITGDTQVINNGKLYVTKIYGGGCGAAVQGSTSVRHTGFAQCLYGGGMSAYGSEDTSAPANVSNNVTLELIGGDLSNPTVFGGGDASKAEADVGGDVTIHIDRAKRSVKVYGGGSASSSGSADVAGNVSIAVENTDMAGNGAFVCGGGAGYYSASRPSQSANVGGNVAIRYEKNNFGHVFGGGVEYSDILGDTHITVLDCTGAPTIHAGGRGDKKHTVTSKGDVQIELRDTLADTYTLGEYAAVKGKVEIDLLGGGADRTDTVFDTVVYNRDEKLPDSRLENAIVRVAGDCTVTEIYDFPSIVISSGGILREHATEITAYGKVRPVRLFNGVNNIRIEEGGTLDLLQDNTIGGDFYSEGNLTTVSGEKMIVDGTVTGTGTASYTSSNFDQSYRTSVPFLQTKSESDLNTSLRSTDETYFVDSREGADGVVREWYLNRDEMPVITAMDRVLTVGDSFDPLEGVSAWDKEDQDLTESIVIVENTVETSSPGVYQVVFSVIDSYGHTATQKISVTVNPRMVELNHIPEIEADDRVLTAGDPFHPLDGVTASDEEDGDLTDEILVTENTVRPDVPGVYIVTYEVRDQLGASARKTITVTVNPRPALPEDETGTDASGSGSDQDISKENPETGDRKMATMISAAVLSTGGIAVLTRNRRRREE